MGKVKITYTNQFADDLADLVYFIESKGLIVTARKYIEKVYEFIESLRFDTVEYAYCKDKVRSYEGLKCISYKGKYTIVFYNLMI
jgi:hypothetical protein